MSTQALNLQLMAQARAIVEAQRGPMPEALPLPRFNAADAGEKLIAQMQRASARDAYEREVRKVFDDLKAGLVLVPVVRVSRTAVMA